MSYPEPCLCGDPECGACFPQPYYEQDPDEAYDQMRQAELDENFFSTQQQGT